MPADERYGGLVPQRAGYDRDTALRKDEGGLGSSRGWLRVLSDTFRAGGEIQVLHAEAAKARAWTHYLGTLDDLDDAMISRERSRRRFANLNQTLAEEESHASELEKLERQEQLLQAQKRVRQAQIDLDRLNGAPPSAKARKDDPLKGLKESLAEEERIREEGEAYIREQIEKAKAAGIPEDDKEFRRTVDNAREKLNKILADVREKR